MVQKSEILELPQAKGIVGGEQVVRRVGDEQSSDGLCGGYPLYGT